MKYTSYLTNQDGSNLFLNSLNTGGDTHKIKQLLTISTTLSCQIQLYPMDSRVTWNAGNAKDQLWRQLVLDLFNKEFLLKNLQRLLIAGCLTGDGEDFAWLICTNEITAERLLQCGSNAEEATGCGDMPHNLLLLMF